MYIIQCWPSLLRRDLIGPTMYTLFLLCTVKCENIQQYFLVPWKWCYKNDGTTMMQITQQLTIRITSSVEWAFLYLRVGGGASKRSFFIVSHRIAASASCQPSPRLAFNKQIFSSHSSAEHAFSHPPHCCPMAPFYCNVWRRLSNYFWRAGAGEVEECRAFMVQNQ